MAARLGRALYWAAGSTLPPHRPLAVIRPRAVRMFTSGRNAQNGISDLVTGMETKIKTALDAKEVEVLDNSGDGRHVQIYVVSPQFEGKNAVQRQRLVYKAIWEEMQESVHAVDSMTTRTPAEAGL